MTGIFTMAISLIPVALKFSEQCDENAKEKGLELVHE